MRASLCPLCPAGDNYFGQLGDGRQGYGTDENMPTAVIGNVTSWTAISAGYSHTSGLAAGNGAAFCWGEVLCVFESHRHAPLSTVAAYVP
jgi:hypothetical protein